MDWNGYDGAFRLARLDIMTRTHLLTIANKLELAAVAIREEAAKIVVDTSALTLDELILQRVRSALESSRRITEAADRLGISRRTLHRYINKWGLKTS